MPNPESGADLAKIFIMVSVPSPVSGNIETSLVLENPNEHRRR
jgi:hypothetical protein